MYGWGLSFLSLGAMAYLAWRLTGLLCLTKAASPRWIWIVCGILWAILALGQFLCHDASFPGASTLEQVGMSLLGVLLLCVLTVLLVDLCTGFGHWGKAHRAKLFWFAFVGGLCLSILAVIQGTGAPEVVAYEVTLPGLPKERDDLRVVVLSDLHLGATLGPRWLEARIVEVQALNPDLIVLLGDVFEGYGNPDTEILNVLQSLQAPLGVLSVNGNHEGHGSGPSPLEQAGVKVLMDAMTEPVPGLWLAGRSQTSSHGREVNGSIWVPPASHPKGGLVLLAHFPLQIKEAAASRVGLMLAGHTHGGQIWPFDYLVGMKFPVVAGTTQIDDMTLIVHRGTGTSGPRMRLWRRGEISLIRLRAIQG
jgi:predicted MPP superfamily phosphohydrolase